MDYIKTWKEVILRPSEFYSRMPTKGGYADPLTFAAIIFIINALLVAFVRPSMLASVGMHNVPRLSSSIFLTIIKLLIVNIMSLFTLALIFNFLYKALGGTGSYGGTLRFLSYASAPTVLTWIPILNLIIAVYELYLYVVGGMIVHNVSMKKSTIIVLPYALLTVFLVVQSILLSFAR